MDYLKAIEDNQPDRVYDLLEPRLRQRLSRSDFRQRWQETRSETLGQARLLREELGRGSRTEATAETPSGIQLSLMLESGRFVVDSAVPSGRGADSPRGALRALVRALEDRDLTALLALLAPSARICLDPSIDDRVTQIKANLSQEMVIGESSARIQYTVNKYIYFILENSKWKILSMD